ncbi:recombinase family protein [Gimesia maris]|uniref:recombinase family protein n=1 Tax=Gimesia maris TaxID=122 RepID=UPI0030DD5D70|tara:strand:+ start:11164 stop:11766 length:603 start_codon:yes stop_codon:yes gene_type:complete
MAKSTAVYMRVSTKDQKHASQLPDLERWCEAHGGEVIWFKDTFSGRTMSRPGMDQLLESLRMGKLDKIVVWRLDRLGRTTKGLCQLFDELRERRVDLVSLKDGFSLESPAGRLHARILASVAEYETEIRAERVAAGQAVARKNGKRWGGSEKGWRWKVTDDQVNAIHEMKQAGKAITKIARVTGLSRPTIYRVLREVQPL